MQQFFQILNNERANRRELFETRKVATDIFNDFECFAAKESRIGATLSIGSPLY
jgi:hypothetical protein